LKPLEIKKYNLKTKQNLLRLIKRDAVAYLMLAPKLILMLMFTVYPIFWALRFIFYDYNGVSKAVFIGFDNIVRAFTRDLMWWKSVLNTFVYAFGKLSIEIPLAMVLAVILNTKIKGRGFFRSVFFLPTVTSAAVISLVFTFIYSPYNGALNSILHSFGFIKNPNVDWLGDEKLAMISVIIVGVWHAFGQNMILILSGLQGIPTDVYESAKIDGASSVQAFFKITLPLLAPMLQLILMIAIIGSLSAFDSVFVLTGGGPNYATQLKGITIYQQFFAADKSPMYGYGATLAVISSVVVGLLTIFYLQASKKMKNIDQ
jgi:raffinose/stachyose/melibiose transport system permease protein